MPPFVRSLSSDDPTVPGVVWIVLFLRIQMRRVLQRPAKMEGKRNNRMKKDRGKKGRGGGRASARLHGVTRKYGAPKASRLVQRGHNVSIRGSLEGP